MNYNLLKQIYRRARAFFETTVSDSFLNELIWRLRDRYKGRKWIAGYCDSIDHYHRRQIVSAIKSFSDIDSVLEIGCNSGPNIFLIQKEIQNINIYGIDINKRAVQYGKDVAKNRGINNVSFFYGRADDLSQFEANSIDVVLSDAVLMFVGPKKIGQVFSEIRRVVRKGIVLNEYHSLNPPEGYYLDGRWVYNYKELLEAYFPSAELSFEKSAFSGAEWDTYGTLIVVKCKK